MSNRTANPGDRLVLALAISASLCLGALPQTTHPIRRLTFEERVRAQEAIERIYYSHQTGATRPFEEAVPRTILEQKVRTYLKQSLALERFWKTPVTAAALQREMARIAANTRFPERLEEVYSALGRDSFVVLECLARPVLVDRLSRNFFALDERIHDASRQKAEELRRRLITHPFEARPEDSTYQVLDLSQIPSASHWRSQIPKKVGEVSQILEERHAYVLFVALGADPDGIRVARHTVPKLSWDEWWPMLEHEFAEESVSAVVARPNSLPAPGTGSRPRTKMTDGFSDEAAMDEASVLSASSCVPDDTWDNGILDDLPAARTDHTLVWTGTVMLIWGGRGVTGFLNDGARYDPVLDTFTPISTVNAPQARWLHTAVWTGREMVVWGGRSDCCFQLLTGGRYDPASDTWAATSTVGAPPSRSLHSAVWTGTEMIVWGGYDSTGYTNSGGRYNPASDTWVATSLTGAPARRADHTAVWTGSRMIVWGGSDDQSRPIGTGGLYDPAADRWTPVPLTNAPEARTSHTAVWSGSDMIVWGGTNDPVTNLTDVATGGRYDPATNLWVATATAGAPEARHSHAAIWTGSEMIIWGGKWFYFSYEFPLDSGGRYDPASDTWVPTALTNAPPILAPPVVWTGNLMIVWSSNMGGRYDPAADAWTPTSTLNAPSPTGSRPTAVWTGSVMIVWTAAGDTPGGRYDPLTDSWRPTATFNSPIATSFHTAVWTGDVMVVWGGGNLIGPSDYFNTGARYDPITDTWQPTSTANAPEGRNGHTAVWTGREMIVWGGQRFNTALATGGRYDPVTDTWAPTSTAGAPTARQAHAAVWTGSGMIAWGGISSLGGVLDTGGLYDPATDTWKPTSTTNAPSPRLGHGAVWTGTEMIVWGGTASGGVWLNTGGRYDPRTDTWMPTSVSNAPEGRSLHTAVWTGTEMIVWGGSTACCWVNTGGRYNPATDAWAPTSTIGAPSFGSRSHAAVWTGSFMIVWGANWGGRYALGQSVDDDSDGYSECAGDCNDANPRVWFPPAEVLNLTVAITTGTFLSWESQSSASGPETEYEVASGSISEAGAVGLASSACLFSGASTSSLDPRPDPPRGEGVWYLVRARNSCGVGTYGTPQRDQSVSSCP